VLEHPALLDPGRVLDAFELEDDRRLDLLVEADLEEVNVAHDAANRIALLVLHDHRLAPAAVDLDVEQRVSLGEHRAQPPPVDLERDAVGVDPVDDPGHEPLPAKPPARARAPLLARFQRQQCPLALRHDARL
jgi:hypothetical protein